MSKHATPSTYRYASTRAPLAFTATTSPVLAACTSLHHHASVAACFIAFEARLNSADRRPFSQPFQALSEDAIATVFISDLLFGVALPLVPAPLLSKVFTRRH